MAVREESRAGSTGEILDGIHHIVKPFRILHTECSRGLGGQEFRVLHEVMGMKDRGHQVILAVQPSSQLKDRALKCGLCVEPVDMRKSRWISLVSSFTRLISKYNIDVINTHGSIDSWTASIAGRLSSRKPIIIRTRHKSTPISNNLRHWILYQKLPHAIVTTGQAVKDAMVERNGIDEAMVVSIPTGVDLERYRPQKPADSLKKDLRATRWDLWVGTVAFLRDYKGLDDFIQAAKLTIETIPETRFLIVGSGPEEKNLAHRVAELNLSHGVVLTGFREDIPQILSLLDVFVLPSVSGEGIPQVLTQALAMERAVVMTRVGGIPEIVQHGITGLLVDPRSPPQLADAICTLLRDKELRAKLGLAGKHRVVENYSLARMLDRTEELYSTLLRNPRFWAARRYGMV